MAVTGLFAISLTDQVFEPLTSHSTINARIVQLGLIRI